MTQKKKDSTLRRDRGRKSGLRRDREKKRERVVKSSAVRRGRN